MCAHGAGNRAACAPQRAAAGRADGGAGVRAQPGLPPPDPAGFFSEGGEVIKLYIEGSLMIPIPGIKRVTMGMLKIAQALEPDRADCARSADVYTTTNEAKELTTACLACTVMR